MHQQLGFKLEEMLDEAIKKLNIFNVIMCENLIIKTYGKEFYGIDHCLIADNYIITIQDKWSESTPDIAQIDQFINVSEELVKKTGNELVCALFISKKKMTLNGLQKLNKINRTYPEDKYYSLHANNFDALISDVIEFITETTKLKGITEIKNKSIVLRPDQTSDVDAFKTKLLDPLRIKTGIMVKPTGSGKTIIAIACIGEFFSKYKNRSVLWITERKDVLKSQFDDEKKLQNCIDSGLLPSLKEINFLTWYNEKSKITELNKKLNQNKPVFLVTNSASLLWGNKYELILKDKFGLIIFDESHWVGARERHLFATYTIKHWTNLKAVLGFSATPLRQDNESIARIKKVFGDGKHVHFISVMTFIDAIEKNIIVPPEYYWIEINNGNIDLTKKINLKEYGQMLKYIDRVCGLSVTKKAIFWDQKIDNIKKWKTIIEAAANDKKLYPNLSQYKVLLTYSGMIADELNQFINYNGPCMLLAVEKGKEGFDDPRIDLCGNLNYVENRSITKSQQQDGRALRSYKDKTKGIIIDCFCFDKEEEKIKKIVNRISGYMLLLKHVESLDPSFNPDKEYEKITKLLSVNEKDKIIELKINKDKKITFNIESAELKNINWGNISNEIKKEIKDSIYQDGITCKKAMEIIKNYKITFESKKCYLDLCKKDPRLPENPNLVYQDFPGWATYLFLDKTKYYTKFDEMKNSVNNLKHGYKGDAINLDLMYNYCRKKDSKLPPMPCEYYGLKDITNLRDVFSTKTLIKRI